MSLTEQQKKKLRGLGHKLKPVIMVGNNGLTKALLDEFDRSLAHHELLKIKLSVGDRETRDQAIETLREHGHAELIQRVGNTALLFRKRKKNSAFETL